MDIIKFEEGAVFPSDAVKRREEGIKVRECLFDGRESEVFLNDFLARLELAGVEHYSINNGGDVMTYKSTDGAITSIYESVLQGVNVVKPITTLFADLLFAEGFTATDNDEQANIWLNGDNDNEGWMNRVDFQAKCHKGQLGAGQRGNAVLKVYQDEEGKAKVDTISAVYWYPLYNEAREKYGDAIVYSYAIEKDEYKECGNDTDEKRIIRVVIYEAGKNTYKAFICQNERIESQVEWDESRLGQLPAGARAEGLDYIEDTGFNYSMIQTVVNEQNDKSIFGDSDYTQATIEQIRELCIRSTQIGRILDKNSDPGMAGSDQNVGKDPFTGENIVRTQGKYITVGKEDVMPQFITWDGNIEANNQAMKNAMNVIYQETGTNAAALAATTEGITVISGAALEKVLMRPLSKVKVKKMFWTPTIKRVLMLAYQIENGNDTLNPKIKWFDGLPKSRLEELTETQMQNGRLATMSQLEAIKIDRAGITEEEALKAYDRLLLEQKDREGIVGIDNGIVFGETEV